MKPTAPSIIETLTTLAPSKGYYLRLGLRDNDTAVVQRKRARGGRWTTFRITPAKAYQMAMYLWRRDGDAVRAITLCGTPSIEYQIFQAACWRRPRSSKTIRAEFRRITQIIQAACWRK